MAATGRSANENEYALTPIMARRNLKLHNEAGYIDARPLAQTPPCNDTGQLVGKRHSQDIAARSVHTSGQNQTNGGIAQEVRIANCFATSRSSSY